MKANDLRQKYLDFFAKKDHEVIPSAPLVPENDPTTLFTSSGMQPLVPYLLGEAHPSGKTRLANSQLCFRAGDIEEIGDNRHLTFFEMLGNWSLGDYFKREQLVWFFEFLTKEVGLNPEKIYVSVFAGNEEISRDEVSIKIWQELFKNQRSPRDGQEGFDPKAKIYLYDVSKNWWSRSGPPDKMPPGEPGGATSEVFYDFDPDLKLGLHKNSPFAKKPCHINCDCGRFLEIGNSVFMEYQKTKEGSLKKLPQKNVDFGGGLERILAASQNQPDVFKTEFFFSLIQEVEKVSGQKYDSHEAPMRIIADHLKAATFMIHQGIEPSNKQQGYILRRLLRRAAVKMRQLKPGLKPNFNSICQSVIKIYQGPGYFQNPALAQKRINQVIGLEMDRFVACLDKGLKIIAKTPPKKIDNCFAFNVWQTYGFPFEVTQELLENKGVKVKKTDFTRCFKKHQKKSRLAAKGMFKGGLADSSREIIRLHTATHLLHQALREVLGKHVSQVGSNITAERLRFDFTHPEKLTSVQIKKVQKIVNEKIDQGFPIKTEVMTLAEARKKGALAFFAEKYGQKVKVYSVGDFSKEVCGGPHVENTGQIGHIRVRKEESIGAGKRRVYAVFKGLPHGS
jgi:alanyl-tRNA synthetase